jgi:hypothetical protein
MQKLPKGLFSAQKLDAVISELVAFRPAYLRAIKAVERWEEGAEFDKRPVRLSMVDAVYDAVGPNLGGGADWIDDAFHLGPGEPWTHDVEPYLLIDQGENDAWTIVLWFRAKTDDDEPEIEELESGSGIDSLVGVLVAYRALR